MNLNLKTTKQMREISIIEEIRDAILDGIEIAIKKTEVYGLHHVKQEVRGNWTTAEIKYAANAYKTKCYQNNDGTLHFIYSPLEDNSVLITVYSKPCSNLVKDILKNVN